MTRGSLPWQFLEAPLKQDSQEVPIWPSINTYNIHHPINSILGGLFASTNPSSQGGSLMFHGLCPPYFLMGFPGSHGAMFDNRGMLGRTRTIFLDGAEKDFFSSQLMGVSSSKMVV